MKRWFALAVFVGVAAYALVWYRQLNAELDEMEEALRGE